MWLQAGGFGFVNVDHVVRLVTPGDGSGGFKVEAHCVQGTVIPLDSFPTREEAMSAIQAILSAHDLSDFSPGVT